MRPFPSILGATVAVTTALATMGCGSSQAAAASVKLATEPPTGCQSLGAVEASASGGHNDEQNAEAARQELRARAAKLGGNVVVVQKELTKGMMAKASGQVFLCPSGG
jgi:hypothetical protein